MKSNRCATFMRAGLAGLLLSFSVSLLPAQQPQPKHTVDMTLVRPEAVGFSSQRLENLHALIQQSVDGKQIAGAVTILARHGKIVDYRTYGVRDLASPAPMTRNTIFRDYSMTKPVTGVAMMILYEEGKWLPSDPLCKIILVDPDHAPTMRELMSHTAGFTYGFFGQTPVDKMYQEIRPLQSQNLQE